jgi:hypothetical protein
MSLYVDQQEWRILVSTIFMSMVKSDDGLMCGSVIQFLWSPKNNIQTAKTKKVYCTCPSEPEQTTCRMIYLYFSIYLRRQIKILNTDLFCTHYNFLIIAQCPVNFQFRAKLYSAGCEINISKTCNLPNNGKLIEGCFQTTVHLFYQIRNYKETCPVKTMCAVDSCNSKQNSLWCICFLKSEFWPFSCMVALI